jgi:hypothetical protein
MIDNIDNFLSMFARNRVTHVAIILFDRRIRQ